jgi:hypothetical protein
MRPPFFCQRVWSADLSKSQLASNGYEVLNIGPTFSIQALKLFSWQSTTDWDC